MRISYVQRCYYQPVTEYVQKSYYEPVTKNVTSYYYEPVTEYKYSTYYDPCTGCPQKVCTPCTSYRLRSKCNSVTSYVERCAMVPVTTLKPVTVPATGRELLLPAAALAVPCRFESAFPHRPQPVRASIEFRTNPPSVVPGAMPPGGTGSDAIPPMNLPINPNTSFPKPGATPAPPGQDRESFERGVGSRRGGVTRPTDPARQREDDLCQCR